MSAAATRPLAADRDVAVVGMAGRFPGARNVDELWRILADGVEAITFWSREQLAAAGLGAEALDSPRYVRARGVLDGAELFDAAFFGLLPREAEVMDPQQRVLLECAWETLEDAGCDPRRFPGLIGVFAGAGANTYAWHNLAGNPEIVAALGTFQAALGNERDFLATNISYRLDLRGPSFTVQSACSTSLVAVHLAMQSLLGYECDLALAGGVTILVPQLTGYWHQEGGILSPDGHCRAYDAAAAGTVGGSGAGLVALKRLGDALAAGDTVRAVLRGSAVNNDGAQKVGFTAPSVDGQAEVIAAALAMAGVDARDLSYVEGHGTGTPLGDPIELRALTRVFRAATGDRNFCALGSVKTNLGHLDAAAGIAGLIKTVLALEHRTLPPSLHYRRPNPRAELADSPFYVNAETYPWVPDRLPRRAAISAFGIGGTNAHLVLEEAPEPAAATPGRPCQLLPLSARSVPALEQATAALAQHLGREAGLSAAAFADVAYTLQAGRRGFEHRRFTVATDPTAAAAALCGHGEVAVASGRAELRERPLVFLFPGQGTQRAGMAAGLYRHEPEFRADVDQCAELLLPALGLDLRQEMFGAAGAGATADREERLRQTALAQPALFTIEYSLARLWMRWGLRPAAMLGHSLGELVAACLAGVMALPEALGLVAVRGQLLQELPPGAMLSVELPQREVEALLGEGLSLAAINAPCSAVLSGEPAAVAEAEAELARRAVRCRRLRTSHAFHSRWLDPVLERFAAAVAKLTLRRPAIPFLSNVSGSWISDAEATAAAYWVRQLRQTVYFGAGAAELLGNPYHVFLEVGPGTALRTLVLAQPAAAGRTVLASLPGGATAASAEEGDLPALYQALGRLWLGGFEVDWDAVHAGERRRRVRLPTYPFERRRYWIEPRATPSPAGSTGVGEQPAPATPAPANEPPAVALAAGNRAAPAPVGSASDALLGAAAASPPAVRPPLPTPYVPPADAREQELTALWEELLGVAGIGVADDFFDLGGHSLLAIAILEQIERRFGAVLPASILAGGTTIRGLARQLAAAAAGPTNGPRPLRVVLQAGGAAPPLWWIHPIGGSALCYRHLVRQLGPGRPLYAIQAAGLDGVEPAAGSIEEMAARYVAELVAVQPAGPHLLAGWSFGGLVAYEMSRQLQAGGREVRRLVLLDSWPLAGTNGAGEDEPHRLAAGATGETGEAGEARATDATRGAAAILGSFLRDLAGGDGGGALAALPPAAIERLFTVWSAHLEAAMRYRPAPATLRAELLRAAEPVPGVAGPDAAQLERVWSELTGAKVAATVVPGSHYTMLAPPHVEVLAAHLQRCLEEAR